MTSAPQRTLNKTAEDRDGIEKTCGSFPHDLPSVEAAVKAKRLFPLP